MELASWVRPDLAAPDGVPRDTGGPSPAPYDLLALRDFGTPQRAPGRDFEPNPLVCVLGTDTDHQAGQVHAGMALYRVLLTATADGLAASMLSQPIELPERRRELRAALRRTSGWPQMVLRFGYGIRPPRRLAGRWPTYWRSRRSPPADPIGGETGVLAE